MKKSIKKNNYPYIQTNNQRNEINQTRKEKQKIEILGFRYEKQLHLPESWLGLHFLEKLEKKNRSRKLSPYSSTHIHLG